MDHATNHHSQTHEHRLYGARNEHEGLVWKRRDSIDSGTTEDLRASQMALPLN